MYYSLNLIAADTEDIMASQAVSMPTATGANMGSDLKPAGEAAAKVKPCCICKEEKATRDECMLFSNANDPQKDCATTIDKYKSCMAGFGFSLP